MVKHNCSVGDRIKLKSGKDEYEGILLESSEDERDILLLKLDSGYNIGFSKKDIKSVELVEKAESKRKGFDIIKKDSKKPNIGMIITGGTISARHDPKTGGVNWLDSPESMFKFYPELFDKVNILKVEVPFMKASEDMDYKDWQKIAKSVSEMVNDNNIQGVIVSHGTDFLHYTAAALSFFLKNLTKPVVLTYSQRSIDRASSDANLNLKCSALAAISDICEVMLVGHATQNDDYCFAMPGTKVRKLHSSRRDAFKVVNDKPFAKIDENNILKLREYNIRKKGKVSVDSKFEEKVALLKVYPGQNPDILDYYINEGYKGLVLEMSGLGHVPTERARNGWTKKLKEVIDKGLVVCATTQTIYGRVDPLVYSNGRELLATGVIYLEDMLSETALVKLGWVLGHDDWCTSYEIIKKRMLENISGEFNIRLEE
jgi:glutamyl-tRNA(Gln) amidotransferase subunit D